LRATKKLPEPVRQIVRRRRHQRPCLTDDDWNLMKRRVIVKQNPEMPADRLCALFDLMGIPAPLKFHAKTWTEAYKVPRSRRAILSMLSRDRQWEGV